jgi:LmbE family N-acetylglucosaminyl deacetylase
MKAVTLFMLLLSTLSVGAQQPPRVLLAVFAHPDDETFAGPVLARYAREGVEIHLAIATNGQAWSRDEAQFPPGPELGALRKKEATCACEKLAISTPIFFELMDGQLGCMQTPIQKQQKSKLTAPLIADQVQAVTDKVQAAIEKLHPQVIVTWGPEGGYGHPDHRMVSDAVTQVVQSKKSNIKLYYVGFTTLEVDQLNPIWATWFSTDDSYLSVKVSFTPADTDKYHQALACHVTQFDTDGATELEQALDKGWGGTVSFRQWNQSSTHQNDLFK